MSMILEINHWFTEDQKAMWELMSSIAATLAALATFVTVREMRKARRDLITPDLYIAEKNVVISYDDFNSGNFYFLNPEFMFELFNLGTGSAKEIKAIWEFNIDRMLDAIEVKTIVNKDNVLILEYKGQRFFFDRDENKRVLRLNFVLGKEKATSGFYIISTLMTILELQALSEFDKSDQRIITFNINQKYNPQLIIEFLDQLGKRYLIRFDVTIGITVFREEDTTQIKSVMMNYYFQKQNNVIFKPKVK